MKKRSILKNVMVAMVLLVSCNSCNKEPQANQEKKIENGFAFGIDISQYNGEIDWSTVASQRKTKEPIRFAIIRATMGTDKTDSKFQKNFEEAKKSGLVVGAYHYYRPNENSAKQFQNFSNVVHLEKGDILPVVDIEVQPRVQSMGSLKIGLRNFVNLCEEHYGVKPIIYTKLSMWRDYLQKDFADCKVWIAAYSQNRRDDDIVRNADIHQFTDGINSLPGIPDSRKKNCHVDGNDCKKLRDILIP